MKQSPKSRAKAAEVSALRKALNLELLQERGMYCQACPKTPVGGHPPRMWTDKHEVLSRGRGGSPTDKENILCLCRECHHFITVNPEWAEAAGFARKMTAEEHAARYGINPR